MSDTDTAPVAADTEEASTRDFETEARAQSWVPESEYTGKRPWVDAETFVKKGEELAPFLQANNRKLEKELAKANSEIGDLKGALTRAISTMSKAEERAFTRAKAELEGRLEQAGELGDVAEVKKINKELVDLHKDAIEPEKDAAKPSDPLADPAFQRDFDKWKEDNAWYETDSDMADWAKGVGERLHRQGMSPREQLVEVAKRAKTAFPHKFTNPRRSDAAAVEAGGTARRSAGKGYSDLPADAKAMCDDMVKSIKGFTREKYAKDYFAS